MRDQKETFLLTPKYQTKPQYSVKRLHANIVACETQLSGEKETSLESYSHLRTTPTFNADFELILEFSWRPSLPACHYIPTTHWALPAYCKC